jgi:hypothetical protein
MFSVFSQAAQGANLSPAARAFLRLVEGIVAAAVVTAVPLIASYLQGQDFAHLDYAAALRYAVATLAVALLMAGLKYAKAHADSPLVEAASGPAQQVVSAIEAWGGVPNDVKVEPDVSGVPAPAPAPATSTAA